MTTPAQDLVARVENLEAAVQTLQGELEGDDISYRERLAAAEAQLQLVQREVDDLKS